MSNLAKRLTELQNQKLKVDFFKMIRKSIGDVASPSYKTIEKDVKDSIFSFIDAQVDMLESGEYKRKEELETLFTKDEVQILKTLATRAMNKVSTPQKTEAFQNPVTENPTPISEMNHQDKMSFALANRSLGGKIVIVLNHNNEKGEVVGIDAPHIVVKLQSGKTVKVVLSEIQEC